MKGKIDNQGYLWLERKGVMKRALCPVRKLSGSGKALCGDYCALFCEPEDSTGGEIELSLCHTFHIFKKEDFKDER